MATGCSTAPTTPCAPGTGTGAPLGANAGTATPSAATAALFNLANSNAYYAPALTAIPDDFTIAVNYVLKPASNASLSGGTTELSLTAGGTSGYTTASAVPTTTSGSGTGLLLNLVASSGGVVTGGSVSTAGSGYVLGDKIFPTEAGSDGTAYFTVVKQGAGAPWGQATDIQDNHYVYTLGATAGGPVSPSIVSLSSTGTQNWATLTGTSGGCGSFGTRCELATDTLGNVWVVDGCGPDPAHHCGRARRQSH